MQFIIFILLILYPLGIIGQFNMTEYRKMPPLYVFDDYDECLDAPVPSSYCLVIGEIIPNATSKLWNYIANFSSDTKRHFRHDYLHIGVCVNHCKEIVDSWNSSQKDEMYKGGITNTELTEFFTDITENDAERRMLNDKVINNCLNYKYKEQYGLELRTFIEYCDTNDPPPKFDYLEIIFFVIVGTLLFLGVLSTSYDRRLRNKNAKASGTEFYQKPLQTPWDTLLTSFSIYRNYFRLNRPPKSDMGRDFRFIETFRFFATLMIVLGHVLLLIKSVPSINVDFLEKMFYKMEINTIISGTVIVQIFFVMTSFFLCLHFQQVLAPKKPALADWGKMLFFRYVRLAPSLGFMILLSASILPRLQDGPDWRHVSNAEYVLCRRNWWANMLLINNFMIKKTCLHQTWYIATDFQLYALLAALLIFIARFPKTRNYILGGGVFLSFLIPGLISYFLKLDGTHQETPNSYRYLFWTDSITFYQGYIPFYMNFGGFFFGMIAALIYIKYKKDGSGKDLNEKKKTWNMIIYLLFPIAFLSLFSGTIFYHYKFDKPSIVHAIFAAVHRNVWALGAAVMILLMSFKFGSLIYKFSSVKMFVPLGRLSFQVYLIQSIIIRCIGGGLHQPFYANYITIATFVIAVIGISLIFAFFLYIFLELPLAIIINTVMKGSIAKPSASSSSNGNQLDVNKDKLATVTVTTSSADLIIRK